METPLKEGRVVRKEDIPTIALRISDEQLYKRLEKLSKQQKLSMNMAVNMLLGFAFNEVERQKKRFVPRIIFESQ